MPLQQRPSERKQQILTSQRRFTTGGLRSDQIARAQRRAQYEQKLMRMKYALNIFLIYHCKHFYKTTHKELKIYSSLINRFQ